MNKNQELKIPRVDLKPVTDAQIEPDEKYIIPLNGKLLLSSDPIMIGKNFRSMINMRPRKGHPESILGMQKVNTSIINSTYYKVRSAIQFVKTNPQESHILAQCFNTGLTTAQIFDDKSYGVVEDLMVFDTANSTSESSTASRLYAAPTPPTTFTLKINVLFPALGTLANVDYAYLSYVDTSWRLGVIFASDGLYIQHAAGGTTSVGNIVKCNATADWQTWRFQTTRTSVEVFLDGVSQGTASTNYATGGTTGTITWTQYGQTTNNMESRIGYIKIATGLGAII